MVRMDKPKVCNIQTILSTIQLTHTYKNTILGCYSYISFSFLKLGAMFNMTYTCSDQAVGGQENELKKSNNAHSHPTVGGQKKYQIQINQNIFKWTNPFKKTTPMFYFFNYLSSINHGAVLNPTYKCSDHECFDRTACGQENELSKLNNKTNSYSIVGGGARKISK